MAPWDTEVHSVSGWIVHIGKVPLEVEGNVVGWWLAGCLPLSSARMSLQESPLFLLLMLLKSSSILSRKLSVFITAGCSGICGFDKWAPRLNQLLGASRKLDSRPADGPLPECGLVADSCLGESSVAGLTWRLTWGVSKFNLKCNQFLCVLTFHTSVLNRRKGQKGGSKFKDYLFTILLSEGASVVGSEKG